MNYMDTMAGPGLMGIVVPMGQRQQRKYKGVNPVTMNRYLSRFDALCNWYTSYKQRLHVHLGDREYRRLLLGVPQTPSFGKRNELFYNNVEKFEVDLRAECSVNTNLGIFLWPCPSSKSITSYFGNRVAPKAGASTDHKGIDIGASMGESVIAAAAGRVTTVAYSGARGYYIVVVHGNGYETLYQHLSRQDVRTGDMITAGQQIGAVGETGISTAPHLHFEIQVNGTPVDPLQFYD